MNGGYFFMSITQIVEEAHKLACTPYHMSNPSFASVSPVYIAPTSNIKAACKIVGNAKSVLAVGGMGAIGYEMALNGAEKIDLFDINILQKMYAEIVKAGIINFDYDTFIKYFTLPYQQNMMPYEVMKNLLSPEMYLRLRDYLSWDTKIVYDYLYHSFSSVDLIASSVYRFEFDVSIGFLRKFASLYNKRSYYILQELLRNNPNLITYQTASLIDIPSLYTGGYDAIILDNILQYFRSLEGLDTVEKVDEFVKGKLNAMLNPGGTVEVNYGYELRTAALKRMLKIPYNKKNLVDNMSNLPPYMLSMASDALTEKEMQEGLNTNLIFHGGYDYHFIPGVEIEHKSDNVVLTYTRHK